MNGLTITGNTPFERAEAARTKAHLLIMTHLAVKELVDQLRECDVMINAWKEEASIGKGTEEALSLAAQALKDKKLFEAALVEITKTAGADLGLEA